MPQSAVDSAVKARLAAHWTRCPVLTDLNVSADIPQPPFLTVLYPVSNAEQMSIGAPGANVWREEGVFHLILQVPRSTGSSEWLIWTDELAALFRGKTFDGVQTFAPAGATMDDDNEDGNFFEISIAVPYHFDLIG